MSILQVVKSQRVTVSPSGKIKIAKNPRRKRNFIDPLTGAYYAAGLIEDDEKKRKWKKAKKAKAKRKRISKRPNPTPSFKEQDRYLNNRLHLTHGFPQSGREASLTLKAIRAYEKKYNVPSSEKFIVPKDRPWRRLFFANSKTRSRNASAKKRNPEGVRLTNGEETFLLGSITEDEHGPVHGIDSRGSGYTRCDLGYCDHPPTTRRRQYWHDDSNTETLWVAGKARKAKKRNASARKKWISAAIKRPGALRKKLHAKRGKKLTAAQLHKAERKGGLVGREARLAETLRRFKHAKKNKAAKKAKKRKAR